MPRSFLCYLFNYYCTWIVFKYCSKFTSYFILFALPGNKTTNGGADNSLRADNIKIPAGGSKTYVCRPKAYGRYLYIRIPRWQFLTVCEVEVHSYLKSESKSAFLSYSYAWCLCVYCRFQIDLCILVCVMSREFTREAVMKFLPAPFSWNWCKCLLRSLIHSKISNLTKYREVIVKYSLLITHVEMPLWIWYQLRERLTDSFFK